jgi:hypothetical protein
LNNVNIDLANAQKVKEVKIPPKQTTSSSAPIALSLAASINDLNFEYQGGTNVIEITTNISSWSVTNMPDWCNYETGKSFLKVTCAENSRVSNRAGRLTIKAGSKTIDIPIMQSAAAAYLSLSRPDILFDNPLLAEQKTVTVTSNYPDWEVTSDANWCSVSKINNYFQINSIANYGNTRTATLTVKAGNVTKYVSIVQNGGSITYGRDMIEKAMDKGITQSFDNGKYKGIVVRTLRSGFGCYLWENGNIYIGEFSNNYRNGYAIYMIPDGYFLPNCPDCQYFVGQWINEKRIKGKCYDSQGNLIYNGAFSAERPDSNYPSRESYPNYKFDFIKDDNGNIYIGETYNKKREGYGMYIWNNGDVWYGSWENGQRNGSGVFIKLDGTSTTGQWNGDNYNNN